MNEPMSDERLAIFQEWLGAGARVSAAEARELLAEVERLRAWKAEAMTVHSEWEATWIAAGRPGRLGSSKAVGVRDEVARLRAALAEAEAHVSHVALSRARTEWRRAEDAEAALARVTDDSAVSSAPIERIENIRASVADVQRQMEVYQAAGVDFGPKFAWRLLSECISLLGKVDAIRAAAAGEPTEGGYRG